MEGAPHPRLSRTLVGQESAARSLADSLRDGRLHHAWLLGGPDGIGKATLAYRIARRILASPGEHLPGGDGIGVDPDGRTARQIAAGAHPNLVVLERAAGDGDKAAPRTVGVEAIRKALGLFATTAANGGYRVCIIDPVEDLTLAAANALLKTIEEPPARSLLLVVSHAPQRVLPTIRSRCRRLDLRPLASGEVRAVLGQLEPGEDPALLDRAAAGSEGSVARALGLLDPKRLALLDELERLLAALPDAPARRVMALADKLSDRRGGDDLPVALDAILRWLAARAERDQRLGPARLAPLAEVCETMAETARTVETYNLDRRAFVVSIFGDLAEAVRRAA